MGLNLQLGTRPRKGRATRRVLTHRRLRHIGPGLGLAIVKSIVALHGGTVAITSTTGTGTTVVLRFPGNAS